MQLHSDAYQGVTTEEIDRAMARGRALQARAQREILMNLLRRLRHPFSPRQPQPVLRLG
ncbi:MAG: hypothetical protein Kilf2KO_07090 [Rhodospirillales bacterium]